MKREETGNNYFGAQIAAISKSQMVIEFDIEGNILSANDKFLTTIGYSLEEVIGKHHRIFAAPEKHGSVEYREFWNMLMSVREQRHSSD